ncbi:MAG: HAD-superfamily hydrolase, subfamily variant 3 [Candidatus Solibacter sp.]|jgi:beta-phosphoglucomutase|nr:HAD-superfamily hydrolase, subfamily variant 3 [Candidatus Solibacter sp.]
MIALLFDMDGVIVDSNPMHRHAWEVFNLRYGVETTQAMHERMYGKRNDEIVRDFFGDQLSADEVSARGFAKEALYREMVSGRLEEMLVPGLREFLARHRELPMGVASNAEPENVSLFLEGTGLRPYFGAVVDGHQVERPKPFPDIYLRAAEILKVDPADCVVFEDSHSGVAAGRAAGMRVIGLCTTHDNLPGTSISVDNFLSGELELWLDSLMRSA